MLGDLQIGDWEVQPSLNRLRQGDRVVRLEPKVMQVLVRLAESAGEVVTREELIARVWSDVFVTDDVLHRAIRELRRVFGDATEAPAHIETIRKRGYRLIAPVTRATTGASAAPAAPALLPAALPGVARQQRWPFSIIAAFTSVACGLALFAIAWRVDQPQAHARFVPLVSGPLNESDPAISPDGNRVAYVQRDAGESAPADIYVREVRDGRVTKITSHPASDRVPAWSHDGTRLAFVRATPSSCEVMTLVLNTGHETRVTACGNREEPRITWSRDDRFLLMSSSSDGGVRGPWQIVRVDTRTGESTGVTEPPTDSVGDHSPAISPDGRSVAFIRTIAAGVSDVYVRPLSGGPARRITFDETDLTGVDWSADSRSLVYSSDRAGGYTLWRVPLSGGEPALVAGGAARLKHPVADRTGRRVVYENWQYEINVWDVPLATADRVSTAESSRGVPITRSSDLWNLYPQLSPDGSRVVYVSTQSGSHELWLAQRDGTNPRQLSTTGRGVVKDPRWSPDGRYVAYLARRSGSLDVEVIDTTSGQSRNLTASAANETAPAWSPDGRSILFGKRDDGGWNVWTVDINGLEAPRVLLKNAVAAQSSPDGQWLYFTRPDRAGVWRASATNLGAATLVADAVSAGATSTWVVTARGLYLIEMHDDSMHLRLVPAGGGAAVAVARLDQMTWPGVSISPDGRHALYARWDRRQSNIMSIEY